MPRQTEHIERTACRLCGAIRAKKHEKTSAFLCAHCWGRYETATRGSPHTDLLFNYWLARQVTLNVRRLDKYGVMGRCEAVSKHSEKILSGGHQCGNYASARRDGRRVCDSHKRSLTNEYVDSPINDQYAIFRLLATELAGRDEKFRASIRQVVEDIRSA